MQQAVDLSPVPAKEIVGGITLGMGALSDCDHPFQLIATSLWTGSIGTVE
jgi:hypothetical protein